MNMGSGILDIPFLQYGDQDSPEYLWHSVRDLKVIAPPETTYHYNNSIYALGGYVGALAQGVPIAGLLDSYTSAMKARIFDPIGMPASAVTDEPQTLSRNLATPYVYDLTEDAIPRHPGTFGPVRALAPAASVATTMNDMSRYLITQLQGGVTPNGKRIVSETNLEKTWEGQIEDSPISRYGLGWFDIHIDGSRLVSHPGSIDGFKTEMTMLPSAGIGLLIFSNSDSGSYVEHRMRDWVLLSIGAFQATSLEDHLEAYEKQKVFLSSLRRSIVSYKPDCAQIADFAGGYEKDWIVQYDDDHRLWLTRDNYYRVPLLLTDDGYLLGGGWDDLTLSSPRAVFVRDGNGSRRMDLFRVDAGSPVCVALDSVRLIAAKPASCTAAP